MDLKWQAATGPAGSGPRVALVVGSVEVARMMDRLDGTWFALLRYPGREAVTRDCTNFEAGRAGCETWARRHRFVLEAYAERRHLEWLACQTWRGVDSMRARERLAALETPAAPASLRRPGRWMAVGASVAGMDSVPLRRGSSHRASPSRCVGKPRFRRGTLAGHRRQESTALLHRSQHLSH